MIKYFTILIGCLFAFNLQAQRFSGGIKGGLNASQVDGDRFAGFNKLGLNAGVFTFTSLQNNIRAQLELNYSSRGAYGNYGTKENPNYYQLSLNYAELPFILKYDVYKQFGIEAGLALSFLSSYAVYDNGGRIPDNRISPKFNKTDFNYLLGFTYSFNENLYFSLRYGYSIVPIRKRNTGNYYYGWLADKLGYNEGDFNNYVSLSFVYTLTRY
jgi:hypothetical protein